MAELLALLEIRPCILECSTGDTDGSRRSVYASDVQAALHGGKSPRIRISTFVAVETCEAIIFWNAHSIELEVPSEEAVVANLVNYAPGHAFGKRAWLFDHQECFEPGRAWFIL